MTTFLSTNIRQNLYTATDNRLSIDEPKLAVHHGYSHVGRSGNTVLQQTHNNVLILGLGNQLQVPHFQPNI